MREASPGRLRAHDADESFGLVGPVLRCVGVGLLLAKGAVQAVVVLEVVELRLQLIAQLELLVLGPGPVRQLVGGVPLEHEHEDPRDGELLLDRHHAAQEQVLAHAVRLTGLVEVRERGVPIEAADPVAVDEVERRVDGAHLSVDRTGQDLVDVRRGHELVCSFQVPLGVVQVALGVGADAEHPVRLDEVTGVTRVGVLAGVQERGVGRDGVSLAHVAASLLDEAGRGRENDSCHCSSQNGCAGGGCSSGSGCLRR